MGLARNPIAGQPIAKKDMTLKAGPLNGLLSEYRQYAWELEKKSKDVFRQTGTTEATCSPSFCRSPLFP
jgi:hypothetical protein